MIVVLGMHRSGTSLVAGLLHHLGVYVGDFSESAGNSPLTWERYEDPDFVRLNQQLLTLAGGSWQNPPAMKQVWVFSHSLSEQIQRLIRERTKHALWGFKDPRTCLTVSLWHYHLTLWSPPRYVIVWRERDHITHSLVELAKSQDIGEKTEAAWTQLIGAYWGRILDFLVTYRPQSHSVWFEQLMDKATQEESVQSLAEFCGVAYDPAVLDFIHGKGHNERPPV